MATIPRRFRGSLSSLLGHKKESPELRRPDSRAAEQKTPESETPPPPAPKSEDPEPPRVS